MIISDQNHPTSHYRGTSAVTAPADRQGEDFHWIFPVRVFSGNTPCDKESTHAVRVVVTARMDRLREWI